MRALVVYESMFGNTRTIAEAIAEGLSSHARVDLLEVGQARGRRRHGRPRPHSYPPGSGSASGLPAF